MPEGPHRIERRVLGKTGLEVGLLGLGGANHARVSQKELTRERLKEAEQLLPTLDGQRA